MANKLIFVTMFWQSVCYYFIIIFIYTCSLYFSIFPPCNPKSVESSNPNPKVVGYVMLSMENEAI